VRTAVSLLADRSLNRGRPLSRFHSSVNNTNPAPLHPYTRIAVIASFAHLTARQKMPHRTPPPLCFFPLSLHLRSRRPCPTQDMANGCFCSLLPPRAASMPFYRAWHGMERIPGFIGCASMGRISPRQLNGRGILPRSMKGLPACSPCWLPFLSCRSIITIRNG
jgi:hypothetical protein